LIFIALMAKKYSQFTAFKSLTVAALRSIIKSPSSMIFTIAFPLIFILVFGYIGGGGNPKIRVAFTPSSDTNTLLYQQLSQHPLLEVHHEALDSIQLVKAKVDALLSLQKSAEETSINIIAIPEASASVAILKSIIQEGSIALHPEVKAILNKDATIHNTTLQSKPYKSIDFILPGQLGFSLLAASVFGTAFVFFNLRQGLVLKRFFATPIYKTNILIAEGIARMSFQMLGAVIIIAVGHYALGYTLIQGWITVVNMLLLCALSLLVFMSFGFIISGVAKSEATIPPLSNIATLPQFLLAGTFFPIERFPGWLQPIAQMLPLTHLNNALRAVAFDGANLWDVKLEIGILLLWGIVGYWAAARFFKWE
jgi:ABC-2 type transport system permease protein